MWRGTTCCFSPRGAGLLKRSKAPRGSFLIPVRGIICRSLHPPEHTLRHRGCSRRYPPPPAAPPPFSSPRPSRRRRRCLDLIRIVRATRHHQRLLLPLSLHETRAFGRCSPPPLPTPSSNPPTAMLLLPTLPPSPPPPSRLDGSHVGRKFDRRHVKCID